MTKLLTALPARYAVDVQPFISTEETRYYLNGFHVCRNAWGDGVHVVATDGHRMGVFNVAGGLISADLDDKPHTHRRGVTVRVEKPMLQQIKSYRTTATDIDPLWLCVDTDEVAWLVDVGDCKPELLSELLPDLCKPSADGFIAVQPKAVIDGTYPDWRRVLPAVPEKYTPTAYNPAYLAAFGSVSEHKGGNRCIQIAGDGTSPALVRVAGRPDFIGVLMPMRFDGDLTPPDWLHEHKRPVEEPEAEAA